MENVEDIWNNKKELKNHGEEEEEEENWFHIFFIESWNWKKLNEMERKCKINIHQYPFLFPWWLKPVENCKMLCQSYLCF